MKVAIVYDRVNKWGGAERVLLSLHELFPDAPLYTSVYHPDKAPWAKVFPKVVPSFLNKISFLRDKHEYLAFLMPLAFESFNFDAYDLVISVTSEAAKGIITKPGTLHICYCLTPTRYLWSHHDFYFKNPLLKIGALPLVNYLRIWDRIAASKPDVMVGISKAVCRRIKKYYGIGAQLIYSPVDLDKFKSQKSTHSASSGLMLSKAEASKSGFFLLVSRLNPYKRADLAVCAFNELGLPLIIAGAGSEEAKLRKMSFNNIKFVGELTDAKLIGYYQKARALIFPQEEDLGLVAVEAQACGTPVIALRKGGALDTVVDGVTGVFFERQNKDSLIAAVKKFEKMKFNGDALRENAQKFSKERFKKELLDLINKYGKL